MKTIILIVALVCVIVSAQTDKIGGQTDSNGCAAAEGYTWCQKMNSCIRPWEVAKKYNISNDVETISRFCQVPSSECLASAGYTWCNYEGKCVRPWELAKAKGLENTKENIAAYCNLKKMGSTSSSTINTDETDSHGCLLSAGYTWCQRENKCVRPWELAKAKGFDVSLQSFRNYCIIQNDIHPFTTAEQPQINLRTQIGGDKDEHGCLIAAGFTWCSKESKCVQFWQLAAEKGFKNVGEANSYCADCIVGYSYCQTEGKCVRTWELAAQKGFPNTEEAFSQYCSPLTTINTPPTTVTPLGGNEDSHGCIGAAGYSWCQTENKCVRPWELAKEKNFAFSRDSFVRYCGNSSPNNNHPVGGSTDSHGCIAGAGYSWCPAEGKCVRPWELARAKGMTMDAVRSYCS